MDNRLSTLDAQGNMLETGGMFYLDLSSKSIKEIQIKSPIRVEIQTSLAQPRLQQYEGQWKEDNLVWNNPKELDKTMSLVDLNDLYSKNGQPQGYNNFHKENIAPQKVLIQDADPMTSANCEVMALLTSLSENNDNNIQQTWLATQEFQARSQCLLKACSVKGLELYIENTNLELWKADKMVAELLEKEGNTQASNFRKFAALKYTVARSNKPFSPALIQKIKKSYNQNIKNKNFFSYPITTTFSKTGYMNLDCVLNPDKAQTKINNCQTKTKLNNSPKGEYLEVFLVFKGGKSLVTTKQIQNSYECNFVWIPLNQEVLFVAKSKDNNYIGWEEVVVKDSLVETDITLQAANEQGNYKSILNSYLDPATRLQFAKEQQGKCCEGYWSSDSDTTTISN
ncbi:MAG: hypothetical protein GY810_08410 [Aureispira sp.]|nr:hypothetical protein [Aureispira sp.]